MNRPVIIEDLHLHDQSDENAQIGHANRGDNFIGLGKVGENGLEDECENRRENGIEDEGENGRENGFEDEGENRR